MGVLRWPLSEEVRMRGNAISGLQSWKSLISLPHVSVIPTLLCQLTPMDLSWKNQSSMVKRSTNPKSVHQLLTPLFVPGRLDRKEIQPVHPKGNQSLIFIGRTYAEAETPIVWPPDEKNRLIGKDPDAGKD